jgi:hypothetical protein
MGRYTPPRRIREAAHAASSESGIGLTRRAGVVLGTGALVGAGLVGLVGVGSASAVTFGASAFSTGVGSDCFPTAGTVDSRGNNACAITQSGTALADSSETGGYDQSNNSAFAEVIGSLGGFAGAFVVNDDSHYNANNSATAITSGDGHAVAAVSTGGEATHNYRNTGIAETNGGLAEAQVNNVGDEFDIRNFAEAISGPLSEASATAANDGSFAFDNTAVALANNVGEAMAGAGDAEDTSDNAAWADAAGLSEATAFAGEEYNNHGNAALASANTFSEAYAQAGGFKEYEYNNLAEAGALGGGNATALAGDCDTGGCGGSRNTAVASALAGGTSTADISGNNTGIATSSGPATSTVDESATGSTLTTSADPGGMAYATDGNANWALSLNFNGTPINLSNGANG